MPAGTLPTPQRVPILDVEEVRLLRPEPEERDAEPPTRLVDGLEDGSGRPVLVEVQVSLRSSVRRPAALPPPRAGSDRDLITDGI